MKWLTTLAFGIILFQVNGQSIVGTWQVTTQTNCLESEVSDSMTVEDDILKEFAAKSQRSPKIMRFNSDHSGEESIKTIGEKRTADSKKIQYKFDGETLYIMDRKSKLIVSTFTVETLSDNSLVYYTAGKACEKTMLVRTK